MRPLLGLTCFWFSLALASAQQPATPPAEPKKPEPPKEEKKADKPESGTPDKKVETQHTITLEGKPLDYTAVAGTLSLKDAEGKPTAGIFYIAYTKKGVTDPATRPLTFSFNGGPGSSSVWMHMGLLGPKRVKLRDDGFAVPPPYQYVDNEFSLLDQTDLVFIDPVGTGYSRAAKPADAKNFYGLNEDARSIAEFIRLYTTKQSRWPSPKFLIGESYGTTRAAALSGELLRAHRMNLNGIMLVSTVLDFQTIWGTDSNDLPYILYLPSYTAVAWHHKKLPAELQSRPLAEVLKQAEAFATSDYAQALLLGSSLPPDKRATVLKQMARFTGLKETYLDAAELRVPLSRFNAELLREQRLVIGRFDGRYTSFMRDRLSNEAERDPSADAVFSAFAATFNHYVRQDLKFEDDRPYNILANVGKWNWDSDNRFASVTDTLAESMATNPFLKIHISSGYFDLATPYFATRHTFNHLNLPPALLKNVTEDLYTAGHMMYLNLPDLKKQKTDLARFIQAASKP